MFCTQVHVLLESSHCLPQIFSTWAIQESHHVVTIGTKISYTLYIEVYLADISLTRGNFASFLSNPLFVEYISCFTFMVSFQSVLLTETRKKNHQFFSFYHFVLLWTWSGVDYVYKSLSEILQTVFFSSLLSRNLSQVHKPSQPLFSSLWNMLNDSERLGHSPNTTPKTNHWTPGSSSCKVERSSNVLSDLGPMTMRLCIEDDVYEFLKLPWQSVVREFCLGLPKTHCNLG
jgi:hypothetical protein